MLARRGCASRICLSCRFTLARSEVVARHFPRPHPRLHSNNPNIRLLSSSLSLRESSKRVKDAPTDDPFAAIEVARRQGTPELPKSPRRQSKKKAGKKKKEDSFPEWGLAPGSKPTPATTSPPTAAPINEAAAEPNQEEGESQYVEGRREETSLDTSTAEVEAFEISPSETELLGTLNDAHEPEDQPIETTTPKSNGRSAPRQDIQHLQVGVKALGQPGGAIILDNPDVLFQGRPTVWDIPQETRGAHDLDIKLPDTSVTKEGIMAEAMANIEDLNLRDNRELGEKELQRHRDSLANSFTAAQLEAYLKASTEAENVFLAPDPNKTSNDSIPKSAVEWRLFPTSTPTAMTKKQRLAHEIITRAWNVENSDSSKLGFMHLEVDPDLYEVLARKLPFRIC